MLLILPFVGFGAQGGDQPDIALAPVLDDHQYPPGGVGSKNDKTLLDRVDLSSTTVMAIGSSNTKVASAERTPCFATLLVAFPGSRENRHDPAYAHMYTVGNQPPTEGSYCSLGIPFLQARTVPHIEESGMPFTLVIEPKYLAMSFSYGHRSSDITQPFDTVE